MTKRTTGRPTGRPPKPIKAAVKRTRNKPGAKGVDADPIESPPPDDLGDVGRETWKFVTRTAHAWLRESDLFTLRLLCDAMDRREDLLATLDVEGEIITTEKGYRYPHPAVGTLSGIEKQITAWSASLGLTATDRGRMIVAETTSKKPAERLLS